VKEPYVVVAENGDIRRIKETLYGPPYPGLEARVNAFFTTFEAVEKTRHEENQQQLTALNSKMGQRSFWVSVAGVAVAFASLMVAIAAIAATIYLAKHADLEPTKLFSREPNPVVSSTQAPNDAHIPSLAR
jgi:predicted glutamine amidotransferase